MSTNGSRVALSVAIFLLALSPSWLGAANRIFVPDASVNVGDTGIAIAVNGDSDDDRYGFAVAIKYDPAALDITGVEITGTAADGAEWTNGQILSADGKLHWGVVMDLSNPITKVISAGTNIHLLNLRADVKAAAAGTTDVIPQDGLAPTGQPSGGWTNTLVFKGDQTVHPTLAKGTITIVAIPTGNKFQRGNCDGAGTAPDLTDAIFLLTFLFIGGEKPKCLEACDANGASGLDLTDAVYILSFLFQGGAAPPLPYPACDTTTADKCETQTCNG